MSSSPPASASDVAAEVNSSSSSSSSSSSLPILSSLVDLSSSGTPPTHESLCRALLLASREGLAPLVSQYLSLGADPNTVDTDFNDRTPAHKAAIEGHTAVLRLLADARADLSLTTTSGRTPLHCAARRGDAKMVKLLLKLGADPNVPDNAGKTPRQRAKGNAVDAFSSSATRKESSSGSKKPDESSSRVDEKDGLLHPSRDENAAAVSSKGKSRPSSSKGKSIASSSSSKVKSATSSPSSPTPAQGAIQPPSSSTSKEKKNPSSPSTSSSCSPPHSLSSPTPPSHRSSFDPPLSALARVAADMRTRIHEFSDALDASVERMVSAQEESVKDRTKELCTRLERSEAKLQREADRRASLKKKMAAATAQNKALSSRIAAAKAEANRYAELLKEEKASRKAAQAERDAMAVRLAAAESQMAAMEQHCIDTRMLLSPERATLEDLRELDKQLIETASHMLLRKRDVERLIAKKEAEKGLCTICMSKKQNQVFFPCGHKATCTTCAERCSTCPICRTEITLSVQMYEV